MKRIWSIKTRAVVVSVGLALGLTLVLGIIIKTILTTGFSDLEQVYVNRNMQRVFNSFDFIVKDYEKKLIDWAQWDDTYNFVQNLNQAYKTSNLVETTFNNMNVEEMLFYDQDGNLKYATASAKIVSKENRFPGDVSNLLIDNKKITNELTSTKVSSGLVKTDDGVLMYVARTINRSDGSGEGHGTLIFGRYVDSWLSDEISNLIQIPVIIENNVPEGVNEDKPILIDTKNNLIHGYVWLPIVDSTKDFIVKIEIKRDIWVQGQQSMNYLLLAAGILALTCAFGNYFIFYGMVVRDIFKFRDEISEVAQNSGVGAIQKYDKNLEIDDLRDATNTLLMQINNSKKVTEDKANEFHKLNNLMVDRELKMVELKEIITDLKKKII